MTYEHPALTNATTAVQFLQFLQHIEVMKQFKEHAEFVQKEYEGTWDASFIKKYFMGAGDPGYNYWNGWIVERTMNFELRNFDQWVDLKYENII